MARSHNTFSGPMVRLGLAAAMLVPPVAGTAADGTVGIRAQVREHLSVRVLSQPAALRITDADVARGYAQIPVPAVLEVRSNLRQGYTLVLDSQVPFASELVVRGTGTDGSLPANGQGVLAVPGAGAGMATRRHELSFSLRLQPSAKPGWYAWPLVLQVLPL